MITINLNELKRLKTQYESLLTLQIFDEKIIRDVNRKEILSNANTGY